MCKPIDYNPVHVAQGRRYLNDLTENKENKRSTSPKSTPSTGPKSTPSTSPKSKPKSRPRSKIKNKN